MNRRLAMIFAGLFLFTGIALAQTLVKGVVTSSEDGQPIIGASVKIVGTSMGTATNADGEFELNVPESNKKLEFSYIGMVSKTLTASPNMRVELNPDNQNLDEVLVVAYGTAKKSSFTGSAVSVDSKKIDKLQVADASKALEGMVPGLSVSSSTGAPGSGSIMRVRGIGSINASSAPLIILDGAPYSGEINSINSKDIENITVLKDAASAALYGARGANGVILITTKSGKEGRTSVQFDARLGSNQRGVPEYDIMTDPGVYYKMMWEAERNYNIMNGATDVEAAQYASEDLIKDLGYNIYDVADEMVVNPQGQLTNARIKYADAGTFNNWYKELYNPKLRQEYNLSVTKGNDKTRTYFSLGYLDDKGFNINSGFDRISSRLSFDTQLYKWLKLSASTLFSKTNTRSANSGEGSNYSNTFMWTRQIAPIYPVFLHDDAGKIMTDPKTGEQLYDDGQYRAYGGGMNLIAQQKMNIVKNTNYYFTQNARFDVTLPFGFSFNTTATYYGNWQRYTDMKNPLVGDGAAYNGILNKESNAYETFNWNQILNWEKKYNDLTLQAMLGHEFYTEKNNYMFGEKKGLLDPLLPEFRSAAVISSLDSYTQNYNIEGFFGQVTADYADKYYLSASLRHDGSSAFHPDHRWGTFYSLGASWRIKEESFLKEQKWLDNLKLRVSYGAQGNDYLLTPNGLYRAYTPYTNLYIIGSDGVNSTYGPSMMGNKEVTWEKNMNFDLGLEFSIFEGLLAGELDFFQRRTNDMLFNLPVPSTTGFESKPVNLGNMKNTGFEFNLTSNVYKSKNVNIMLGVNGMTYTNKVLNLPEEFREEGIAKGNRIIKEGGGIYDFYLVKYAGVKAEDGDALYYIWDKEKKEYTVQPSAKWSSDKINRQYAGSAIPKLTGGFFLNAQAYGFELSTQFAYRIGGKVYDTQYASLMGAGTPGNNWHNDILKRWTKENPNTDVPRVQVSSQSLISTSDRFLIDGSCLSVKNISFGYNLPPSVLKYLQVQAMKIYFAGDNLWLLSKRKGLDPRLTLTGEQSYSVNSAIRSLSFGLTVTL